MVLYGKSNPVRTIRRFTHVPQIENQVVHLAVGIFAGIVTISTPSVIYEGKPGSPEDCTTWHKVFVENEDDPDAEHRKHWDPIGGM